VLEVAATAQSGAGIRAGWFDPGRRGLEDLDGVGSQEPVPRTALGDAHPHPFARKGVPDEQDAALVASDHEATVRDRARVDHDLVVDRESVRRGHLCRHS